jgi:hypothetical protein
MQAIKLQAKLHSFVSLARAIALVGVLSLSNTSMVHALELDWGGQFWTEFHSIYNYTQDDSAAGQAFDATRYNAGGYYVPAGGSQFAYFQTLFLRLKPKVVVNDNVYLKSEFWVGDPVFGLFGNGAVRTPGFNLFGSTSNRGAALTAQRFWAEVLTDIGTLQVGRAPLHWGLGIVWNSGDQLFDRYQSTGDTLRLVSKFGAFSFIPSLTFYTVGNSIGGGLLITDVSKCPGAGCGTHNSNGGLWDLSIIAKYENPDDDFDLGLNFIRRMGGSVQESYRSPVSASGAVSGTTQVGINTTTWDIYGKKRFGRFTLGAEIPIVSGNVAGKDYAAFALATESAVKITDSWSTALRIGYAPGQPESDTQDPTGLRIFYMHPTYRIATLMFNYQFANFFGPVTTNQAGVTDANLRSPFDNPIANAVYFNLGGAFKLEKWNFKANWTYALAPQTAKAGKYWLNHIRREMSPAVAISDQESSLGWEIDVATEFKWDENVILGLDLGLYFPGAFYQFSNVAGQPNATSAVFGGNLRLGFQF